MTRVFSYLITVAFIFSSPVWANDLREKTSSFVYVESDIATANGNSILAYRTQADGSLEALPGSPFLTGGSGVVDPSYALGPFDSDQNVIVNSEHTLLFAVNGGSNSIAVFHIDLDGTLTPVSGSPFASYGVQPVSLGYEDGVLVVVNKHEDPAQAADQSLPNYTSFRVGIDGQLSHIDESTVEVSAGSSPSQALIYRGLVFGADFLGGLLQSFRLDRGYLQQNMPQPLPDREFTGIAAPHAPLGLEISPRASILYAGYPTASKVGIYHFDKAGNLQFLKTVPNSGQAICWLKSNRQGTRLYTSNSVDHSVSVYDTTDPEQPTEIQKLTLEAVGGLYQLALDPSNSFVYVIEQRIAATMPEGQESAIHILKIDETTGSISELLEQKVNLDLSGDTRPQGIAVF